MGTARSSSICLAIGHLIAATFAVSRKIADFRKFKTSLDGDVLQLEAVLIDFQ